MDCFRIYFIQPINQKDWYFYENDYIPFTLISKQFGRVRTINLFCALPKARKWRGFVIHNIFPQTYSHTYLFIYKYIWFGTLPVTPMVSIYLFYTVIKQRIFFWEKAYHFQFKNLKISQLQYLCSAFYIRL